MTGLGCAVRTTGTGPESMAYHHAPVKCSYVNDSVRLLNSRIISKKQL